jgi:hypothetical protein
MPADLRWDAFLSDLDRQLSSPVTLHCLGGFVVTQLFGFGRQTADFDFLTLVPSDRSSELVRLAGKASELHKKWGIYLDHVTVANVPDEYQSRLQPLLDHLQFRNLRLLALEAHDLALSKLERNLDRDRQDVQFLAQAGFLNPDTLQARYRDELRPYLTREDWHDQTLQFWLEMCWPDRFPPK